MNKAIWIGLGLLAAAGAVGTSVSERYIPESASVLLVALAIGLRRATWGRPPPDDER